ncbi:MAG: AAA family ATPase [bacterium]|nr:AAA family ATPase [bacterium]
MKHCLKSFVLTLSLLFSITIIPMEEESRAEISPDALVAAAERIATPLGKGLAQGFKEELGGRSRDGREGFNMNVDWGADGAVNNAVEALSRNFEQGGDGREAFNRLFAAIPDEMGRAWQEGFREGGEFNRGRQQMAREMRNGARDFSNIASESIRNVGIWGIGTTVGANLGIIAIGVAGIATAWFGSKVLWNYVNRKLMQPRLLIDSSQKNPITMIKNLFGRTKETPIQMALSAQQERQLTTILKTTRIIKAKIKAGVKNVKYRNVLLWGPPGTGKTMFAKKLAKESGMDFAMITGSSLSGFKKGHAIIEIDKLFDWGKKSERGLVLFIDEVDSLLSDRSTMRADSEEYKIVNHILNYTGERSDKWMVVMTTNHKDSLDNAIFDRVDDMVHMPLPDEAQREKILSLYANMILFNRKENGATFVAEAHNILTEEAIKELALQTHGLSNRNLHGIINKILTNTQATSSGLITHEIIQQALQEEIEKQELVQHIHPGTTKAALSV